MAIRILHIVGDSKFGGASLGILRLANFWQSLGWEVEILATDPEFLRVAKEKEIPIVALDVIWRAIRPWRDMLGLLRLALFLRQKNYTVVHTHTTKAGFVGRLAAKFAGVPLILHTAHGFAFHERSGSAKIWFYTALERLASLACKRVVAVSHFHRQWGQQLGIAPNDKLLTIPNGIPDPPDVTTGEILEIRKEVGIHDGDLVLFTPGRLAPEKGLEDLLDAFATALRSAPSMRLLIAGEGVLEQELHSRAKELGLEDRVRFLGFRTDVLRLLAAVDIVVLPTWREGLSIALLEAMARGRPIITTSIGSNLEATLNGDAAILVEPMRPDRLVEAIVRLATDANLRASIGCRAREVFLGRYTHQRMLSGYHDLYLALLEDTKGAQRISAVLPAHDR
jgi:glycosyltransferase involved in cell wall biosynthesis